MKKIKLTDLELHSQIEKLSNTEQSDLIGASTLCCCGGESSTTRAWRRAHKEAEKLQ